jgi:hypothetical protein
VEGITTWNSRRGICSAVEHEQQLEAELATDLTRPTLRREIVVDSGNVTNNEAIHAISTPADYHRCSKLDAISRFFTPDKPGVLIGLGIAFQGDGGHRMVGWVYGQPGQPNTKSVLREFDFAIIF